MSWRECRGGGVGKADTCSRRGRLANYRKQRALEDADDLHFPDEVDTPRHISARTRFARYRGLKSFRTSPWDPYEDLPLDYARIFQFEDFERTRRRVEADGRGGGVAVSFVRWWRAWATVADAGGGGGGAACSPALASRCTSRTSRATCWRASMVHSSCTACCSTSTSSRCCTLPCSGIPSTRGRSAPRWVWPRPAGRRAPTAR